MISGKQTLWPEETPKQNVFLLSTITVPKLPNTTSEDIRILDAIEQTDDLGFTPGKMVKVKASGQIGRISYIAHNHHSISWRNDKPLIINVTQLPPPVSYNSFHHSELELMIYDN